MLTVNQVYIQLMNFKSITFHHQGNYFIRMQMIINEGKEQVTAIPSMRQHSMVKGASSSFIKSPKGNEHILSGRILKQSNTFQTNRFEIMYNDQIVYFDVGCVFKLVRKYRSSKGELRQFRVNQRRKPEEENEIQMRKRVLENNHGQVSIELWQQVTQISKDGTVVQLTTPQLKQVSREVFIVNLSSLRRNNIEKSHSEKRTPFCFIPFTTHEYFSTLQICMYQASLGLKLNLNGLTLHEFVKMRAEQEEQISGCCQKNAISKKKRKHFKSLKDFYHKMIQNKLTQYHTLKHILSQEVGLYKENKLKRSKYAYLSKISQQFQNEIIFNAIPCLDYVRVDYVDEQQELDAYIQPQSEEVLARRQFDSFDLTHRNLATVLQQKYECQTNKIYQNVMEEAALIQVNIQYLFQRIMQLSLIQNRCNQKAVLDAEINKIKEIAKLIQKEANMKSIIKGTNTSIVLQEQSSQIKSKSKLIRKHKIEVLNNLKQMEFFIANAIKQPIIIDVQGRNQGSVRRSMRKLPQYRKESQILVVLVHGYKGSQFDLSKIKSYLSIFLGFQNFLSLKDIQQFTDQSIQQLGVRGAHELTTYLQKRRQIRYINFIGFSLGGVIIRAMLPHLQSHKDKFNYLVTFASPHLGVGITKSCLVKTGIFYMNKILGIKNIKQLCNDRVEKQETILEELAQQESLGWLRGAIFMGSDNDYYVSTYSALAHYIGEDQSIREMERNLNKNLKNIIRKSILFDYKGSETWWDKITRRRGHISFLQDDAFLKYFFIKYRNELLMQE